MRNWIGQDVLPGSVVYRGGREGNSSSYKVGTVEYIKDGKARVHWQYEPGWYWRTTPGSKNRGDRLRDAPSAMNSYGNPSLDSLIVLDDYVMVRLEEAVKIGKQWQTDFNMTVADAKAMLDNMPPV